MDGIGLVDPGEVLGYRVGGSTIYYVRVPQAEVSALAAFHTGRKNRINSPRFNRALFGKAIKGWSGITLKRGNPMATPPVPAEMFPDWQPTQGPPDADQLDRLIRMMPGATAIELSERISAEDDTDADEGPLGN